MSHPNQFELLSERRFGPLFWTQFFGALNDNLFKTAFIFLITYGVLAESRDAALWTPMLNGLLILPFFLFSATAGQLADKLEKARLIRWIKLWEVAVMGVAAVGFLTNNGWLLAGTLFLMGTQSAFFGPVKYAILPQALGKDSLVSGNALIGTATFLAILLGSMGGGLLIETGFATAMTAGLVLSSPAWDSSLVVVYPMRPRAISDFDSIGTRCDKRFACAATPLPIRRCGALLSECPGSGSLARRCSRFFRPMGRTSCT